MVVDRAYDGAKGLAQGISVILLVDVHPAVEAFGATYGMWLVV